MKGYGWKDADDPIGLGKTSLEAVAKLWLKLNEHLTKKD